MLLLESMKITEEESYYWLCENKELIEKYYDDILLEDVKIENFYRKYGYVIDESFPLYKSDLIKEGWAGWAMDAIFALGPMLPPPYGTGFAAAGAIYYTGFALKRYYDGDYFSALLDTIAAALSGVQAAYGMGTASGGAGKALLAIIKTKLGSVLGRVTAIAGSSATPTAVKGISRVDEMIEIGRTLPMVEAAVASLDDLIRVYNSNRAKFEAVFREMNVPIDKIDDMLKEMSKLLEDLLEVARAAKAGNEATYAAAVVKFAGSSGKISATQVNAIIKEVDAIADLTKAGSVLDDAARVTAQAAKIRSAEQFSTAGIAGKAALSGGRPVAPAVTAALQGTPAGAKLSSGPGLNVLQALSQAGGKTFNAYLERLANKVPGLLDELSEELIRRFPNAFPPGSRIVPNPGNVTLKVVLQNGTSKYLRVFAQDGQSYTNLGKAILNSSAYKNFLKNAGAIFNSLVDEIAGRVGSQVFVQTIPATTSTITPLVTSATPAVSKGFIATFISAKAAPLITFFSDPKKLNIARGVGATAAASETLASQMDYSRSEILRKIARENR